MALRNFSRAVPLIGQLAEICPHHKAFAYAVPMRLFSADTGVKEEKKEEKKENVENSVAVSAEEKSGVKDQEEWTEVVHQPTGQVYYWNQRTGETTLLGKPKPGSQADDSESAYHEEVTHNPNVEAFLPDKTGTYASTGLVLGIFLAWFSQFV